MLVDPGRLILSQPSASDQREGLVSCPPSDWLVWRFVASDWPRSFPSFLVFLIVLLPLSQSTPREVSHLHAMGSCLWLLTHNFLFLHSLHSFLLAPSVFVCAISEH